MSDTLRERVANAISDVWDEEGSTVTAGDVAIALVLEEAARVAESYEPRCDTCPSGVAAAIRALKEEK